MDSLTGFVPALAAMDGLSTSPYLVYKMVGFDALHVRTDRVCPVLLLIRFSRTGLVKIED